MWCMDWGTPVTRVSAWLSLMVAASDFAFVLFKQCQCEVIVELQAPLPICETWTVMLPVTSPAPGGFGKCLSGARHPSAVIGRQYWAVLQLLKALLCIYSVCVMHLSMLSPTTSLSCNEWERHGKLHVFDAKSCPISGELLKLNFFCLWARHEDSPVITHNSLVHLYAIPHFMCCSCR